MSESDCYEASCRLVPGWQNAELSIERLHGGLSNKLFLVEVVNFESIDADAPTRCIMSKSLALESLEFLSYSLYA